MNLQSDFSVNKIMSFWRVKNEEKWENLAFPIHLDFFWEGQPSPWAPSDLFWHFIIKILKAFCDCDVYAPQHYSLAVLFRPGKLH